MTTPTPIGDGVQLESMVNDLVARQIEDIQRQSQERIAALEAQLAAAQAAQSQSQPLTTIPEHAAGPGTEIRQTWSQAEQEAVSRG